MSRRMLYYDKLWHHQGATSSDPFENQLINRLTPPLKLDVMMFLFKDMILKLPFFKDLTAVVIEELVNRLRMKVFMKGDFLMYQGERGDWMGFISRGVCAVLDPENKVRRAAPAPRRSHANA